MTVLDAQAIVAALAGEPAAAEVETLLRAATDPPRISAINLAEVFDAMVRRRGASSSDVAERMDWLAVGGLELVPLDYHIARTAGELRAKHYHRDRRPVSLADCVALATCLSLGERLATSDPPLAAIARFEGCDVVALPDRAGIRP